MMFQMNHHIMDMLQYVLVIKSFLSLAGLYNWDPSGICEIAV